MRKAIVCIFSLICLSLATLVAQDSHKHSDKDHNHSTEAHADKDHSHDHDGDSHDGHDHGTHDGHDHGKKADGGHGHDSHGGHGHEGTHDHGGEHGHHHHAEIHCGYKVAHGFDPETFDPGAVAFHHISDANIYSIGPWSIPLPCILYAPKGNGWSVFMSSKFGKTDSHGTAKKAYKGYALDQGTVVRVTDPSFPLEQVEPVYIIHVDEKDEKGKEKTVTKVCYNDKLYDCDKKSTADGGLFGGGITSYYDFSITKNVASMFIVCGLMFWLFTSVARAYRRRKGQAPKGVQSLVEPVITFIRDEVAKPFLGHRWADFLPYLLTTFFFILGLNLWGQVPFFGGSNVTGNLGATMVLAIFAFILTNINGNKHYWGHVLWMPDVPPLLKILIITPVEILGLFIKPLTLMLRLFANITAGHMVIVIFISLIFLLGKGVAVPSYGISVGSIALTLFMMTIELLVAFIQAFVFTLLTASYLGAATEEAHH